jgi:hypothetical protein
MSDDCRTMGLLAVRVFICFDCLVREQLAEREREREIIQVGLYQARIPPNSLMNPRIGWVFSGNSTVTNS